MAHHATTSRFRPDLEGLRGVAVALVLLFHARVAGVAGGFVGVDAFFVLSGFLITALLLRERAERGRIDLVAFYARRARRILPAATAVLAATLALSALVVAPIDLPNVSLDAGAAAVFVGNIRFALAATDYFGSSTPSPFLHYWSLGVEEQFYLLWPALLLVALRLRHPTAVISAVFVGSLGLSLWLASSDPSWAFYGSPARAWQLALGGLVAAQWSRLERLPRALLAALGWIGLVGLGYVAATLDGSAPFTLAGALAAAGSVALIVAGGASRAGPGTVLGCAPLRALGRISFSLYLVHWPLLVLPEIWSGTPLTLPARIGLAALALPIAALSWRYVEEPFRRGSVALRWPAMRVSLGGASALAVTALAVGVASASALSLAMPVQAAGVPSVEVLVSAVSRSVSVPSEPAADASPARPASPVRVVAASGPLPASVRARLAEVRTDGNGLNARGCGLSLAGDRPPLCRLGVPDAAVTVALVGDSHAAQWFPALDVIARRRNWTIVPFTKDSCIFLDTRLISIHLKREYVECARWRERVIEEIARLRPALVIVSSSRWVHPVEPVDADPARHGAAMARLLGRLPGQVVVIADTPLMENDVPACLSRQPQDVSRCETEREIALAGHHLVRDGIAATSTGATLVDPTDWLCAETVCPALIDGAVVWQDDHHLTATFARSLAPRLDAALPPIAIR